jgi:hypothetical protein
VVALVALGWSISTFGERTVGVFFGLCAVAFVAVMVARWQLRLRDERAAEAAADQALLDARREREARFERLIAEHGADAAMRIADGKPWQGATQAMVTEMLDLLRRRRAASTRPRRARRGSTAASTPSTSRSR